MAATQQFGAFLRVPKKEADGFGSFEMIGHRQVPLRWHQGEFDRLLEQTGLGKEDLLWLAKAGWGAQKELPGLVAKSALHWKITLTKEQMEIAAIDAAQNCKPWLGSAHDFALEIENEGRLPIILKGLRWLRKNACGRKSARGIFARKQDALDWAFLKIAHIISSAAIDASS